VINDSTGKIPTPAVGERRQYFCFVDAVSAVPRFARAGCTMRALLSRWRLRNFGRDQQFDIAAPQRVIARAHAKDFFGGAV